MNMSKGTAPLATDLLTLVAAAAMAEAILEAREQREAELIRFLGQEMAAA